MNWPLGYTMFLAVFMNALTATATSTAPAEFAFCDMGQVSREQETAKAKLSDETRFHEMERLYNEIGVLMNASRKVGAVPAGFIKNCLDKKKDAFKIHGASCGPTAVGKFPYHFIIGKYLEQQGNTKEAFDHFARASQADPKDYTAPYRAYQLLVDLQSQRLAMAEKNPGGLTQRDVDDAVKEINGYLTKIIENPKAPASLRIDVFQTRARSLELMGREAAAVTDWKNVLDLDPKNTMALGRLAAFELFRGRKAEARKYLELLAPAAMKNPDLQKNLIEIQLDAEDFGSALKTAESAHAKMPQDTEITALYARALGANEQLKEAAKLSAESLKANPKSKIVKQSAAYLHLLQGEKWAADKLPGQALSEFQEALALDPADMKLRTRMAILIFEQRQAMGFKPDAPTKIDLDQTVKLLEPLLKKDYIEQRTVEVMVSAAAKSNKPAAGAPACERYTQDFGSYPTIGLVLDCALNYKAASQMPKARKTLEDALGDSRFRGKTNSIASALTSLR